MFPSTGYKCPISPHPFQYWTFSYSSHPPGCEVVTVLQFLTCILNYKLLKQSRSHPKYVSDPQLHYPLKIIALPPLILVQWFTFIFLKIFFNSQYTFYLVLTFVLKSLFPQSSFNDNLGSQLL